MSSGKCSLSLLLPYYFPFLGSDPTPFNGQNLCISNVWWQQCEWPCYLSTLLSMWETFQKQMRNEMGNFWNVSRMESCSAFIYCSLWNKTNIHQLWSTGLKLDPLLLKMAIFLTKLKGRMQLFHLAAAESTQTSWYTIQPSSVPSASEAFTMLLSTHVPQQLFAYPFS